MSKNNEARRQMLVERRSRQRSRQPGFTPMLNKRVSSAIELQTALNIAAGLPGGRPIDPIDARQNAINKVASGLPSASRSKLYRYRPSKNDDAGYRKAATR